eukprot:5267664-Ditylum_brightwellii.AAC.1
MRIAKDFLREAIQLVATKRPPIAFEIEEGVTDRKLVLRGQNVDNMDATYTLVQDLLRGNTLTAFNNKQAAFKEQTLDNLEHYLNVVTVQVFPNKAYSCM